MGFVYDLPVIVIVALQKLHSELWTILRQKIATSGLGGPHVHRSHDTAHVQ